MPNGRVAIRRRFLRLSGSLAPAGRELARQLRPRREAPKQNGRPSGAAVVLEAKEEMVGATGIEPVTPTMST
jgi:hypothetical protein